MSEITSCDQARLCFDNAESDIRYSGAQKK